MSDAPFTTSPDGSGNPRAVSVRVKSASASTIGGQNAHDLRKGAQPSYVDQARTHLNRVIFEPLTGSHLREIALERRSARATARSLKSNAAVGYVGIITFGHIAQTYWAELTREEQDRALRTITDRIASRLKTTVTGLVLHRDEQAEHAHFQMPGYDLDGNPLSQTARRNALAELQTIAAEVMQRFDSRFERGFSKENRLEAGATPAQVKNKTVAQLHQTQAADLEKARSTLAALNEKIEKNTRLIEKAEAKIEAGKGDLAKLSANIETYTRRLQTAQSEAEKAEARLSDLNAQITTSTAAADTATKAATTAQAQLDDLEDRNRQLDADNKALAARRQEADKELARISANISAANKKKEEADKKAAQAEQAKKESEARQAAAKEKEEEQAERQRKKFQQLEDDEKAYHRAQELIEQAIEIAQINIESLNDLASIADPESRSGELPSVMFATQELGHKPTRLERLEFATGFEPESRLGRRLQRSPAVMSLIKKMFAQIQRIVNHVISEKSRINKEAASIMQTARHQAETIKASATPEKLKSLQAENSNLKKELEARQSFFQFMQSMLKVELGESYAPLAAKVNAAWAEQKKAAPAAPTPPAPQEYSSRSSGPSGP